MAANVIYSYRTDNISQCYESEDSIDILISCTTLQETTKSNTFNPNSIISRRIQDLATVNNYPTDYKVLQPNISANENRNVIIDRGGLHSMGIYHIMDRKASEIHNITIIVI